ncbi:photoreceptor disk component PRCD isoform X2 [Pan troglodytes]|uniref:photoreceptor disk component PRCD isoform X2 n=1 Tax=Pan troglodytes TaxID=9598 RepID=UPI00051250E5
MLAASRVCACGPFPRRGTDSKSNTPELSRRGRPPARPWGRTGAPPAAAVDLAGLPSPGPLTAPPSQPLGAPAPFPRLWTPRLWGVSTGVVPLPAHRPGCRNLSAPPTSGARGLRPLSFRPAPPCPRCTNAAAAARSPPWLMNDTDREPSDVDGAARGSSVDADPQSSGREKEPLK